MESFNATEPPKFPHGRPVTVSSGLRLLTHSEFYEVIIDLEGMPEEVIAVGLCDGLLTISGRIQTDIGRQSGGVFIRRRDGRVFERSFALPDDADQGDMSLSFGDGLLRIVITKDERFSGVDI